MGGRSAGVKQDANASNRCRQQEAAERSGRGRIVNHARWFRAPKKRQEVWGCRRATHGSSALAHPLAHDFAEQVTPHVARRVEAQVAPWGNWVPHQNMEPLYYQSNADETYSDHDSDAHRLDNSAPQFGGDARGSLAGGGVTPPFRCDTNVQLRGLCHSMFWRRADRAPGCKPHAPLRLSTL